MSVTLLTQVFNETRRLAIAGSMVAPGDIRLKKLISPLLKAGQKSPVLARIGEAARTVGESEQQTAAPALLNLSGLINAVLFTQGETNRTGTVQPLEHVDLGIDETQASACVLRPLLVALTASGPGRREAVRDAFAREAFRDLRLIRPALAALDDSDAELADFLIEKILPSYGRAILPQLVGRFDPQGTAGDARRLRLIVQLDPAVGRKLMMKTLAEGAPAPTIAAAALMGDGPDDLPPLLERLRNESSLPVRHAILLRLVRSPEPEATGEINRLIEEGQDLASLVNPILSSRNPVFTAAVIRRLGKVFESRKSARPESAKETETRRQQILLLLKCLTGNGTAEVEMFLLGLWADQVTGLKEPVPDSRSVSDSRPVPDSRSASDSRVVERLAELMLYSSVPLRWRLAADHAHLAGAAFQSALRAARRVFTREEFFDQLSPYLSDSAAWPQGTLSAAQQTVNRNDLVQFLHDLHYQIRLLSAAEAESQLDSFDPRWLDLAVESGHLQLIWTFARPGHAGLNAFLPAATRTALQQPSPKDVVILLRTMVRVEHPEAAEFLIAFLQSVPEAPHYQQNISWCGELIEALPPEHALRFEDLLTALPDHLADQWAGAVAVLRSKAAMNEQVI